ncbi:MAG: hypothetical protein RR646_02520 [Erysipelotrichaceae bacterium]
MYTRINRRNTNMNYALRFPLDIQCFGEGGEPNPTEPPTPSPVPGIDYEQLATVISKRTTGTEDKVLQGYFKSQGLSQEQANEAMTLYKTTQATKQQEALQSQQNIIKENAELKAKIQKSQIDAKIAELASALGVLQ